MSAKHPDGPSLAVAVDIGGTFTDITLLERSSGRSWQAKTPSTPADPSIGFMHGVSEALTQAGYTTHDLRQVLHATTVATNLILEDKGAKTALLTTAGFRHVLEIGRQDIPRTANLHSWVKPKRPVPPERIFEIREALDGQGRQLEALDEMAVRAAARRARALRASSIAICFLHSYANPAHEMRARELVLEEWPDVPVSLSCEVLPVFREFERSMVTVLNAYVMPAVSSYVGRLKERLEAQQVTAPLFLMKSNGGVAGAHSIRREPIQTALSGPAAGAVGANLAARLAGFENVISIDIGGTSADICLIKSGEPAMTMSGHVGAWPLTLPMVDIHTIGAGGGSIADVSDARLSVGPRSAGAVPGPVCYRRGGTEPTVTDAHVVLGNLPPSLLNGAMSLDAQAAWQAIEEKVARPLHMDAVSAAHGILALADNAMAGAIRVVSVERGHDPRNFVLVPFGGAGPLHGAALARLLGIRTLLVPTAPGVLSAVGLLASDLKAEFSRTCIQGNPDYDLHRIEALFTELEQEARTWFESEQIPPASRSSARRVSARYLHQSLELQIEAPPCTSPEQFRQTLTLNFHERHKALYTFAQEEMAVEIVNLHVLAVGHLPKPAWPKIQAGADLRQAIAGEHVMRLADGERVCPIYERTKLGAGAQVDGPAIFTQLDTTTVILPGQRATVDDYGNLVIRELA